MKNPIRSLRSAFIASGFLLLLVTVGLGGSLVEAVKRTLPLPVSVLARAGAGVARNSDWQPVVRRIDGLEMALVPAGCYLMGSTEIQLTEAFDSCERFFGIGKCQIDFAQSETPTHEVCFDAPFWIGETEVTNRLFDSSSSTDMETMYRGPSWPREMVTWDEASHFCMTHHARLPSEAEWEYAARGPDNLQYPWDNKFSPANLISGTNSPMDVGSVPMGASWVGAFDMSGGVAEWVADWYAPYSQASVIDPRGPEAGHLRVLRGGSWFSYAAFFVRTSYREAANPDTTNSTVGFRCARDLG